MATLKKEATNYVLPTTKNISELKEVPVDLDLQHKTVNEGEDNEFSYNYIVMDKQEYRVGNSVLKQLKVHLQNNPDLKKFKVSKEGEGLKTVYTVIPQ